MMGSQGQGFASGGLSSISYLTALSSDELTSYSSTNEFALNTLTPANGTLGNALWNEPYRYIYTINLILEGLDFYAGVTPSAKKQIQGEVLFLRAFINFYLTNLFGPIPLSKTTDYKLNAVAKRMPVSDVYVQIISDLLEAQSKVTDDYSFSATERIRPNKWCANALLARVYLYTGDYEKARQFATLVIENEQYKLSADLSEVFLKNSIEAIWQLKPIDPTYNTNEGRYFRLINSPIPNSYFSLNPVLAQEFEEIDRRGTDWVEQLMAGGQKFYFVGKYKVRGGKNEPLTEYSMVLRLAEQYLIRAEARVRLNDLPGGRADLNRLRNRAGASESTETDKERLLKAVLNERKLEFFMEWGHRWLDLKRLDLTDEVLGTVKAPNWEATDALYPIPQREISNNVNIKQNKGY